MSIRECVVCSAPTKTGERCKIRACSYSEFCHVHTRQILGLYLAQSGIPGAGLGLFTNRRIPRNTNISRYTGTIKTNAEFMANDSGYGVSIPRGRVIDAASTQSNIARYANDCRRANRTAGNCPSNNAKLVAVNTRGVNTVWLKSGSRPIAANTEIFTGYGARYWHNR